ncbi:hypothetical protein PAPYR_7140 [Paratrimastix pyriformis]|uniref:Uncharacterized protein n=1 Tax=Paratrimastix pyriformis TaxID=342808 RepID=A0ABQ8UDU0_9EUKA|nr:hypothetical protein PAPYR_7140 [Paratrimastix pyriformis]
MALMICGHTGAHVPAAQLAGFYNNAHCELLPLQHTLAVAREELHLFWARTRGAANSPVSDRRHDDSVRTPCPTWNHGGRHTTFQRREASCARHAWATTRAGPGEHDVPLGGGKGLI